MFKEDCEYHKELIEEIVRERFHHIVTGDGLVVPRIAVVTALDELFGREGTSQPVNAADAIQPCEHDWQHFPCKPAGFTKCSKCGLRR